MTGVRPRDLNLSVAIKELRHKIRDWIPVAIRLCIGITVYA